LADIFVAAAAVADWKPAKPAVQKLKKNSTKLTLELVPTVDVLSSVARHAKRPPLVIGFAAETENLTKNARAKLGRKGCDWILANDVAGGAIFGADDTQITHLHSHGDDAWPRMSKQQVAETLVTKIAEYFSIDRKKSRSA